MSHFHKSFLVLTLLSFVFAVSSCQKKCTGYYLHEDDECVTWSSRWQGEWEILGHTSDTALVGTTMNIYEGNEPNEVWFGNVGVGILGTLTDQETLNLDTNGFSAVAILSQPMFYNLSSIEVTFAIDTPSDNGQVFLGRPY